MLSSLKELELLEDPPAAQGHHKAKHQTQEAHIAAAITWWRGQIKKSQTAQDPQEAVADMQKRIQSLEVERTKARRGVKVLLRDQGTSTQEDAQIQFRDVAVITDSSVERLAEEDLLRKVEDMVGQALRAAHALMGNEKRLKERIEAIGMRALRTAETNERELNAHTQVRTDSYCRQMEKFGIIIRIFDI